VIEKCPAGETKMVTVTFRVPAESGARSASVASEFNDGSRAQAIRGSSGLTPNAQQVSWSAGFAESACKN